MGKSEHGPDMLDCGVMMAAMRELHGVNVSLTVQPAGGSDLASVELVALAVRQSAAPGGQKSSVSRKHHWPNRDSKTFEGAVYRLLHELDRDCGSFWVQLEFDK